MERGFFIFNFLCGLWYKKKMKNLKKSKNDNNDDNVECLLPPTDVEKW